MLVTICTIRQLPQAFALGDSVLPYATDIDGKPASFLIGLADDPAHLPADFSSPYSLIPLSSLLPAETLAALSATYTPTEFAAACKPLFIREVFSLYPDETRLIYADPNILFLHLLTTIWDQLGENNALLTPHITQRPNDTAWPDEKFFQNVGLYSADFLAFRRSDETDRLLAWWQDRAQERAYINFCAGLCTDQLWLMYMPVFFTLVQVVKNPGWHAALWNLPERSLKADHSGWQITGPTAADQPLLFFNAKGLFNADEGFFPNQNRLKLANRPDVQALLASYQQAVSARANPVLSSQYPAYGQQREPAVLRGWRRVTVQSMRVVTRFIDQVPLPVIR
ncbi:hypothetical protein [Spirosoma utsteinense]|uniref:Uncharacterized protein n=1 Tax=Spirosoma utsteinense TaxID=2585773 RepID=A0ABR6W661_9BACT|nr:hypothetical protein [Spirosoma utsteinense]MBC3786331.1 hypothetical protein [Spirosoma utsteinense]MBC3791957.1 hypothetical protein [Spirosoma utsteinense]